VAPSQPDANTQTRPTAKAQVIPLDTTSKSMSLFVSEKAPEPRTAKAPAEHPSPAHTEPARAASSTTHAPATTEPETADHAEGRTPRITARGAVIALLAVAVLGQGGYIAYDMYRGSLAVTPQLGSIGVTSEPTGAPVMIDGVARGTTPLQIALAPGAHDVQVGSGPQARSQPVTVTAGSTSSLHLGLTSSPATGTSPGTGGLQIATEPPGARVSIDGTAHGVAPITVMNLKAGDHVVSVRGTSGDAVNRTVTVQEGNVASLVISMTAPSGIAAGWLAISSDVPLQILERGTILGTTESPRILLPTGAHELELVNAELGYRVTRSVQIAAGQTASVALKPPMNTISINAVPWAEVSIDGQRIGETPIGNFAVTIGRHELVFRHPELGEQRRSVTVGVTTPVRISADMRKK
jgi:hypothetical protein